MRARWLAAAVAVSAIALADPRELVTQAEQAAKAGDFAHAAALYREAFRASGKVEDECNVGVAFYKAKDLPRAQLYLARCLAAQAQLPKAFVQQLGTVIAAVEGKLAGGAYGQIELARPDATVVVDTFGPDDTIVTPARFWVPAGNHELVVHASGYRDQALAVQVTAGATAQPAIQLEPIAHEAPPPDAPVAPVVAPLAPADAAQIVVVAPPPPAIARPSYKWVWTAGVTTASLAVVAAFSYGIAYEYAQEAGKLPAGSAYEDKHDSARAFQYASWGIGAAAAIAGGITAYLYVNTSSRVQIAPRGDGAAVVWTTSF